MMAVNTEKYKKIISGLEGKALLVAVSKTKPASEIQELYDLGQRDFGENYVQELADKQAQLPADIRWHFIGHLQSNKVKQVAPFVYLVHGVDSFKLLQEINKQAAKMQRVINVLLQVHMAKEETKFGLNENELDTIFAPGNTALSQLSNICIMGLMGMGSFTTNEQIIHQEFNYLHSLYKKFQSTAYSNTRFSILSMGMSSDYAIALEEGSNMVRIGSLLFGERNYNK
jgi:PLP dependent protein